MPTLFWLLRSVGVVGCIILGLLAYYEGLGPLKGIPGISYIPIAREIVLGRVQTYADEAVRRATADLVSKSELSAAKAQLAETQRQLTIATQMADAARKQADNAAIENQEKIDALERRIEADADPRDSVWTSHDLERMRNDRRR